jgi:hypothetical protein
MPRYEGLEGLEVWRFGIGRFGRQRITTPSIKSLNYPLPSTFLHSYPLIKISVRFISLIKPSQIAFKSLPSLKSAGIKPSPWIHIVHIKPFDQGYCTYCQTSVSGLSGYLGYLAIGVCITLGILRYFLTYPPKFEIMYCDCKTNS